MFETHSLLSISFSMNGAGIAPFMEKEILNKE
jgi:hypothetical protein